MNQRCRCLATQWGVSTGPRMQGQVTGWVRPWGGATSSRAFPGRRRLPHWMQDSVGRTARTPASDGQLGWRSDLVACD